MHRTFYTTVLLILLVHLLPATVQGRGYFSDLSPEVVETDVYAGGENANWVEMGFADYRIRNVVVGEKLKGKRIGAVDLVFTRYPFHLGEWEINYDTLMERRFAELEQLVPAAFSRENVIWRVVLQTGCKSLEEAKGFFHGFAVYPADNESAAESEEAEPRFDPIELEENLAKALAYYEGTDTFYDSTCITILKRHPEWHDAAFAIDWTASMFRHGAQLLHWLEEPPQQNKAIGRVFFNDGDGKWDGEKVVGETGGVYVVEGRDSLVPVLRKVSLGGSGGDHRENDLEAVLAAMDAFPEAHEFILVADNSGPVRDMSLLPLIDRPVRILLTGAYKGNFQPDYFTIAYHTGGSLHTRDADFPDIAGLLVHDRFQLEKYNYLLRNGRFSKQKTN